MFLGQDEATNVSEATKVSGTKERLSSINVPDIGS